jgi:hypothetical protein
MIDALNQEMKRTNVGWLPDDKQRREVDTRMRHATNWRKQTGRQSSAAMVQRSTALQEHAGPDRGPQESTDIA